MSHLRKISLLKLIFFKNTIILHSSPNSKSSPIQSHFIENKHVKSQIFLIFDKKKTI